MIMRIATSIYKRWWIKMKASNFYYFIILSDEDYKPILKKVQMDKLPTKVFNGEEDKV